MPVRPVIAAFILISPALCFSQTAYDILLDELFELTPDAAQVAQVDSLTIRREDGVFRLGPGQLVFCKQVAGRVVAAAYTGSGLFSFKPPSEIERAQLNRYFGVDSVLQRFRFLLMMFGDSTAAELRSRLSFTGGDPDRSIEKEVEYAVNYLGDESKSEFNPEFVRTFLNGSTNRLFYAHISQERIEPLFFQVNPFEEEDVRFMRRYPLDVEHLHEIVSQYEGRGRLPWIHGPDVASYDVSATLDRDLSFRATATVYFAEEQSGWVPLVLYHRLDVDSIRWDRDFAATYVRGDRSSMIWVRTEPGHRSLSVDYQGDLLTRDPADWVWIGSTFSWFPRPDSRDLATFRFTFDHPASLDLIAAGTFVSREEQDDRVVSEWRVDSPVRNVSFTPGYFEEGESGREQDSEFLLYEAELRHGPPTWAFLYGMKADGRFSGEVLDDVISSAKLFTHLFGAPRFSGLRITEIPGLHGEAFPGMIQMSWATYRVNLSRGEHQIFRAHEVAHQWWGIGVDFKTYHDQWLSEGLAQYTGLWYMQTVSADNELFFEKLEEWRDQILSNRKFLFGSGQEAGPIWLGYRTQGSETKSDYDLVIYRKGAWVLHMLRNLLIDLRTFNEDTFKAVLRDYYQSYSGDQASTEDFQAIVERHSGTSMEWFFRQWVYGTGIPSYRFAYKVDEQADGRHQVTCRVEQQRVAPEFRMDVPLRLTLADGSVFRIRKTITGAMSEFTLPLLPQEPAEVLFNDLRSVLCEVEYVDWEEE